MSNKINDDDYAKVSLLRLQLAEMERISELRLRLAEAEFKLNKKRSSCVSVVPTNNAVKKVKVETNGTKKNSSTVRVSNANNNIGNIEHVQKNNNVSVAPTNNAVKKVKGGTSSTGKKSSSSSSNVEFSNANNNIGNIEGRIYEWMKYFVASGPNQKTRQFTINDLIEGNKTLKLAVVEDVINSFFDQGIISINLELSSNRVTRYEFNKNHEEFSFLDDVFNNVDVSTADDNNNIDKIEDASTTIDESLSLILSNDSSSASNVDVSTADDNNIDKIEDASTTIDESLSLILSNDSNSASNVDVSTADDNNIDKTEKAKVVKKKRKNGKQ